MSRRALLFLLLAVVALTPLRRVAIDQYWGWRNRIWTDGWHSAWDCAEAHMKAYEDTPERYIAEHGFWWRGEEENP